MNTSSPTPFVQRLHEAVDEKGAPVVVGLDPRPALFPPDLAPRAAAGEDVRRATARAIVRFNELILDAVHDIAVAVKPQAAFYERWGWPGIEALEQTMSMARERGLLVIADGKRNDIGSTASAYAEAWLGGPEGATPSGLEADGLTVNPYLGTDGLAPFAAACRERGKALFVLLRTSNPSGDELQALKVSETETVALRIGRLIASLNDGLPLVDGYGPVGAVVGATRPEEARSLRERLPGVMFLVPGFGAQGAGAAEAAAAFDERGRGVLVNSARGILYAFRTERPGEAGSGDRFAEAARRAARTMADQLQEALSKR